MKNKKFCPNCGGNIKNFQGKFCPHCGHQIYEDISQEESFIEKFALSDEQKEQLKQKTDEITELAKEKGKVYGKNIQTFLIYLWKQAKVFLAFLKEQYKKYMPIALKKTKEYIHIIRVFIKTHKTKIYTIIGIILVLGIVSFMGIRFVKPYLENQSKQDAVTTKKQNTAEQNEKINNNKKEVNKDSIKDTKNISSGDADVSENSNITENIGKENYYYIDSEKSYFYNNPDDTEPRKAYVMKWDVVKIIPEKSTENMFFAVYTNSAGKTTEGYLKKEHLQEAGEIIKADKFLFRPKMQESIQKSLAGLNLYEKNIEQLVIRTEARAGDFGNYADTETQMVLKDKKGTEWYMGLNAYDMFTGFSIREDCIGGCDVIKITGTQKFQWKLWGKSTIDDEKAYPCYAETDLSIPQTKLLYCDMNHSS